jgi:hypothetical protein
MEYHMPRKSKYTKEFLEPLVQQSTSICGLLTKLGLKPAGGSYQQINSKIKNLGISTSHFTGQGWAKGLTTKTSKIVANTTKKNSFTDTQLFSKNTDFRNKTYRRRLLQLGWEYQCSICGLREWLGDSITLHLDHKSGDRTDNRFENLRFLCPNCHQQTETWGRKK